MAGNADRRRARRRPRASAGSTTRAGLAVAAAPPDRPDGVDDPAGRARNPGVALASPVSQPPSSRQAARSSGPAARWIAPSTPPPPRSDEFAAHDALRSSRDVAARPRPHGPMLPGTWADSGDSGRQIRHLPDVGTPSLGPSWIVQRNPDGLRGGHRVPANSPGAGPPAPRRAASRRRSPPFPACAPCQSRLNHPAPRPARRLPPARRASARPGRKRAESRPCPAVSRVRSSSAASTSSDASAARSMPRSPATRRSC